MSERLDRLARGLAGLTSRREIFKYLAGALFLGAAGCRRLRYCERVCASCRGSGARINCLIVCDECPSSRLCGACATLSCCSCGSTCCPDISGDPMYATCTNTSTDPVNCGGCSYGAGATGTDCTTLGLAVPGCCGGVCTDLSGLGGGTCGDCTTVCSSGSVCCPYSSGGTQAAACCPPVGGAGTGTCCTTDSDCMGLTRADSTAATCNSTGCCA